MKQLSIAKSRLLALIFIIGLGCPVPAELIDNHNGTVTDTGTGLTWEQESHGDLDWKSALGYCDALSLGGHDDWRMPTIKELATIADLSRSNPAINTYYFSDTAKAKYWSATTRTENTSEAWGIDFTYGNDTNTAKSTKLYVRAVRGGPAGQPVVNPATFYDNGDGTLTDSTTGLMWQQSTQPAASWKDALTGCAGLNLGNHTDWRLPTIKELAGIVSLTRSYPAINTYYFPDTVSNSYWSSTTRTENTAEAWCINFSYGDDLSLSKSSTAVFRAVRGGPQNAPDTTNVFIDNGNGTVTDYVTGLTWAKTSFTGKNWQQALSVCDSLNLGGFTDWRLPTIKELASIASPTRSSPAINTYYFPDTVNAKYWSSTTRTKNTSEAWCIDFTYGNDGSYAKSTLLNVRAVRGGGPKYQPVTPTTFIDNGDGTITDHITGLMWQQADTAAAQNWKAALAACVASQAGGYSDWRMPNIKELASLISLSRSSPAINTHYFPTAASANYWSSTTRAESTGQAWVVNFSYGDDNYLTKTSTAYVRAVRSGPPSGSCFLLGYLLDAITGKPLAGVTVTVDGVLGDVTDASGIYYIPGLGCGVHTVTVIASGYAIYSRTVDTSQSSYLEIPLTRSNTVYGANAPSGYSADPVNTATGNYIYHHKDFEIPGIGLPIVFERTYNSQDGMDSPLGFGWNHSYNPTLTFEETGVFTVRWGDGRTATWISDGAGGFNRQYGVFDDLIDNRDGTYTVKKKDNTRYLFNADGRLARITDKNSNAIELIYDNGLLLRIIDTAGREIGFSHNEAGRITQITDPAGRRLTFDYDDDGNLVKSTDMNGHATAFAYDGLHQVLSVTDPRGNVVVANTYDENKRVVTCQKDAKQGQTLYVYNDVDRITIITDALGHDTRHRHDDLLRLVEDTDPLGNKTTYAYDDMGNRTGVTDKNGRTTRYTYDVNGNVLSKTDALGRKVTIEYDAGNNPIKRTDTMGNVTAFQYDGRGNLIRTSDALGNLNAFTHDEKGLILTLTDANGYVVTYEYDNQGNRSRVIDAEGQETRYSHDAVGRVITITDPLGRQSGNTWDAMNNLLAETDPAGFTRKYAYDQNNNKIQYTNELEQVTSFEYDVKNLLTRVTDARNGTRTYSYDALDRKVSETDPNGNTTQYVYDAAGNLIRRIDALGRAQIMTYDAAGNKISETNPAGQIRIFIYDALNRLISVTDSLGNTIRKEYDAENRLIAQIDAAGNKTCYEYDIRGRLTKVLDAAGGMTQYAYDGNGNRISVTDPDGHTTRYRYDRVNRLVETTEPLGGKTTYAYDGAGNRISLTDPSGNRLMYAYDNRNRMTRLTRTEGDVTFTYAANGLRTKMTDSLGTTQYDYDELGRLISFTDPFGKTVHYAYDASGNQTSMTYPGGKTVTYTYDSLNRLVSMTDWASRETAYAYNTAGDLVTTILPNGITTTAVYDAGRRMTGLSSTKSDGAFVLQYAFTLDATGNHLAESRTEPLTPAYRAKEVPYTQDAENRLLTAGSTTFVHDANGNMIRANGRTFRYDSQDRLIESVYDGKTIHYSYDGVGNRYVRSDSGVVVRHVLDISRKLPNVIAETTESGEITAWYVYGLGLTAKVMPDGAVYYYHFDARGSTIAMTDANQNVAAANVYGPYGEKLNQTGDISNPFTFMGRYGVMDDGHGMYFARSRYYWPQIGRFVSKDLLTGDVMQTQSLHRYVYGWNNPVLFVDPNGELANWVIGAGIGAGWALVGTLAGDLIKSAATGQLEFSSWETYTGNVVGGAVSGLLYATPGGAAYASVAGSIVGGVVTQGLEMIPGGEERRPCDFDYADIAVNAAMDFALGKATSKIKLTGKPSGAPATHLETKFINSSYKSYYLKKEAAELIMDNFFRKGLFGSIKTSGKADAPYIPESIESRPYDFVTYKK